MLKKKASERLTSGDYEQFSDRLVESINTVRELLKSNKELREQLEGQKESIEKKDVEIFNLQKENEALRERVSPVHMDTTPNIFEDPQMVIHPPKFGGKHMKSKNRDSYNLISANITVHNFNTRPLDPYEAMNSV